MCALSNDMEDSITCDGEDKNRLSDDGRSCGQTQRRRCPSRTRLGEIGEATIGETVGGISKGTKSGWSWKKEYAPDTGRDTQPGDKRHLKMRGMIRLGNHRLMCSCPTGQ
jgi:hypothetical protein